MTSKNILEKNYTKSLENIKLLENEVENLKSKNFELESKIVQQNEETVKLKIECSNVKVFNNLQSENFKKHIESLTKDSLKQKDQTKKFENNLDILNKKLNKKEKLLINHAKKYNKIVDEYNDIQEEYKYFR